MAKQKNKPSATHDIFPDYPEELIINRPELKSRALRLGEGFVTVIFWGFWFYLWLPLVSVFAWMIGFRILYVHMIELGGFNGFLQQLHVFTSSIALLSGALACWSFYNLKRYGGLQRRNHTLLTDMEQMERDFSLTENELGAIQSAGNIVITFDKDHKMREIDFLS